MIVTTDVQRSVVVLTPISVMVQCTFIPGSQSKGCHVKLIGRDHSIRTHNIKRVDGLLSVQEFLIGEGDETPETIQVFDWESDGSIGNLSVPVQILRTAGPGQ